MKPIRLQLQFAPGRWRVSPGHIAMLMAAVAAFVLAAVPLGRTLAHIASEERELAQFVARREAPTPAPTRPSRTDPAETASVQLARQTSQSLMTPWGDLLAALESVPGNVALLSVEPSPSRHVVALTAEAAEPKDMLNYIRALQDDHRLSGVILVSHQVQVQATGTPLRFQVQAHWGDTP
jgi:Tfp pilus assembly protein PilN